MYSFSFIYVSPYNLLSCMRTLKCLLIHSCTQPRSCTHIHANIGTCTKAYTHSVTQIWAHQTPIFLNVYLLLETFVCYVCLLNKLLYSYSINYIDLKIYWCNGMQIYMFNGVQLYEFNGKQFFHYIRGSCWLKLKNYFSCWKS